MAILQAPWANMVMKRLSRSMSKAKEPNATLSYMKITNSNYSSLQYPAACDGVLYFVGRKGSGKTAIYKKLLTKSTPSFFPWGHTYSDYPWHHHDLQAR